MSENQIIPNTSGKQMYELMKQLFPICRSITGNGVRETLKMIKEHLPSLETYEIPTGTQVFDWKIPKEWNIKDAYVKDDSGKKVIDFKEHNLHVMNYSTPVNEKISLEDLESHLHSLPSYPDAIPYVTSYYEPRWGFCLSHNERKKLKQGNYQVCIDSTLEDGSLTYADLFIPGKTQREILISTYVCHPSMANNELSGPVVATFLAKWILAQTDRNFTYRIVFVPETIGSIAYLSRHIVEMKENTKAGFVLTCVGDDRCYSYMPSRNGKTLSDKVAKHVLNYKVKDFIEYTFLERGSDERQYCAPGVDLPVCSIIRSKYAKYPEYHTSLDDLSLVSPKGLQGSLEIHIDVIRLLEANEKYQTTILCEPQLGRRNLRPTIGATKGIPLQTKVISDFLAFCDGELDLIDIANTIKVYAIDLLPVVEKLKEQGIIKKA